MTPTVDDLLAAPIGVVLLDRIEHLERLESVFHPFDALPTTDPDAVLAGIVALRRMSFGKLAWLALEAAQLVGPWSGGAPQSLATAYQLSSERAALAEVMWERFKDQLLDGLPQAQECWLCYPEGGQRKPCFQDFTQVYGNGEFTWNGFWTVTDPPPEIHDDLIMAWEMYPGPITRWSLLVRDGAHVWRIDSPSDWVRLVEAYPWRALADHAGWELPGPNQHKRDVETLAAVPNQHGMRTAHRGHLLPDWTAVAADYDGVHLSWAGFLTTEGFVSDLPDGAVTMLRYWSSERTLWLRDVFGEPEPLPAPQLTGQVGGTKGLDADGGEGGPRRGEDIRWIQTSLGR